MAFEREQNEMSETGKSTWQSLVKVSQDSEHLASEDKYTWTPTRRSAKRQLFIACWRKLKLISSGVHRFGFISTKWTILKGKNKTRASQRSESGASRHVERPDTFVRVFASETAKDNDLSFSFATNEKTEYLRVYITAVTACVTVMTT